MNSSLRDIRKHSFFFQDSQPWDLVHSYLTCSWIQINTSDLSEMKCILHIELLFCHLYGRKGKKTGHFKVAKLLYCYWKKGFRIHLEREHTRKIDPFTDHGTVFHQCWNYVLVWRTEKYIFQYVHIRMQNVKKRKKSPLFLTLLLCCSAFV